MSDAIPVISKDTEKNYLDVVTVTTTETDFYIISDISSERDWYYPLLKKLNTAKPDEVVNIYLNTDGGEAREAMQITSTIKRSKAKINLILEGSCMSAGTIIAFLPFDRYASVNIDDDCDFLFHLGWMWDFGKPKDVLDSVEYWNVKISKLYKNIFEGILTKEEMNDVLRGKELFLPGSLINQRLAKLKR